MSEKKHILKTTGLLSFLTLVSRFTGLARDVIIAAKLGTSQLADVFWITFELPNIARRVLGEGALSAFVIPIFAAARRRSPKEGWRFVNQAMGAIAALTLVITILGMIFSGFIFKFFGGYGILADAEKRGVAGEAAGILAMGTDLTRIMFPYLMILALSAVLMGVCNALNSFTAPALRSAVQNIAMIIGGGLVLWLDVEPGDATYWIAWSLIIGGVLSFLMHFPDLLRAGWSWTAEPIRTPETRELFRMMGANIFGMSIYQINIAVAGMLATAIGPGNKAYLVNSQRLIQFPMALTATAMATAMLPRLSELVLEKDHAKLREVMGFAKRVEIFLMMPATLGLMFFGAPIIALLFQRGEWTEASTAGTFGALLFYAPGLIPQGWIRLIQPLYYARRDVRTPVRAAFYSMFVNIVLAAAFTFFTPMRQMGLALASTLAGFANYYMLTRMGGEEIRDAFSESRMGEMTIKCTGAGLIAIGGAWVAYHFATPLLAPVLGHLPNWGGGVLPRALGLLPFLALAAAAYFPTAHLLRVPDGDRAIQLIRNKFARRMKS